MKKLLISIIGLLMLTTAAVGQQEAMFTQYIFNGVLINPAHTGSHRDLTANIIHRSQWVGFKGSPHTTTVTLNGMLKDGRNAIGGGVFNDYIGITNTTDVVGYYAYHLPIRDDLTLAFGLKGGFSVTYARLDKLTVWDDGDPAHMQTRRAVFSPDIGAGAYLYHDIFFVGVSVPALLSFDINEKLSINTDVMPQQRRHYFFNAGAVFNVHEIVQLKPSFLIKYVWTALPQADINLAVGFKERYWVGTSYRTGDAIAGYVDLQVSPLFRIGYSFDWSLGALNGFNAGSHEPLFGILFDERANRFENPKFF